MLLRFIHIQAKHHSRPALGWADPPLWCLTSRGNALWEARCGRPGRHICPAVEGLREELTYGNLEKWTANFQAVPKRSIHVNFTFANCFARIMD